ncbi:hypothetical protein Slin15195_G059110 [Septoria linicola]|uniref:Uncharacterized protein n=1 Tax=Septoria linicola TaxID=215465 RepID=A0A9Q9EJV7_9PEZI|nr:hypothetical protein Slin14017_G074970 [Septoria linicola]USW52592.1 hypothetical protein Slin15195_G059110 [Septoria linicola]
MPPVVPALPRSDSKARLLSHLGLDMRDIMHRRVYNLMKLEASEGRKRIIAILDARAAERGQLPSTFATSYSTSQIDEAVMDAEVSRIYETAQPATKPLYDLAIDPDQPQRPNWIIRWMLWHVFRYRDGRQHSSLQRISSREDAPDPEIGTHTPVSGSDSSTPQSTNPVPTPPNANRYFDPVRERYRD